MSSRDTFDLEKAIAAWRHVYARRRAFLDEDLDELERHLRDYTSTLVRQGVDERAAFDQALRALGDIDDGVEEYGKVYWSKIRRRKKLRDELGAARRRCARTRWPSSPRSSNGAVSSRSARALASRSRRRWLHGPCLPGRARQEFDDARDQSGLTDIERPARWLFLNKYSFGGKGETWGRGKHRPPLSRKNLIAIIYALAERLHDVHLENRDWTDVLGFYDDEETFFFLDPPYVDTERYVSMDAAWSEEDHAELAATVLSLEGTWLLTYNDHDLVRDLYVDCEMQEVSQSHSLPKKGKMNKMHQLIISN